MPKTKTAAKTADLRVDQSFLNTIQHALTTASHHFCHCRMFDDVAVRLSDRMKQVAEYDKVFQRILDIEHRMGWRKPEARKEKQ